MVWIQSFPSPRPVCHTMVKKSNLPYYLPIDGGRIIGLIRFPVYFVFCLDFCISCLGMFFHFIFSIYLSWQLLFFLSKTSANNFLISPFPAGTNNGIDWEGGIKT